jgi:protein TonB
MPSASLAVARRAHHPDMVRVTALSAAITLNLAALLFAMRPLAPQIATAVEAVKVETVRIIEPPPPTPPPPPDIVIKALPKPQPTIVPHVVHAPIAPPSVPTITEPTDNPQPISPPATPHVAPLSVAPGEVSLAYRSAPLKFPVQALRQRMSGTVTLRVLVDETGKPVDVEVEQSSGSKVLDQSARQQVLASWLFQPAMIDGHAVRAWARVPVSFALQEM